MITYVLCHLNLAINPPPTSKIPPFYLFDSWHKYATKGTIFYVLTIFNISSGVTVANILEAAKGAITFVLILFFSPYFAKAKVNPTNPILAAE
jgi:hypothetical protein